MVVLRATLKVLKLLDHTDLAVGTSDTALGDWYVNRMVIDRRPLLLLMSSTSLLSIITPARDVRTLPERLADLVAARLQRVTVEDAIRAAEVDAMRVVGVAKTADRSITGQLVDFAHLLSPWLTKNQCTESDLERLEDKLAQTPCRASGPSDKVIFPNETACRLLRSTWSRV